MNAQTKPPLVLHLGGSSRVRDIASALTNAGFEVVQASDGPTGLAVARETMPALVLIDVRVPGIDGYEVTRRLRADEATAGIPVVHTSTSPADAETRDDRSDSFDAGADAVLGPKFEAADLVEVARPLIRLRVAERAAFARAETLRVANEMKDEFVVTLGHELRNPLSGLRLGLSLLETCATDAERASRIRVTMNRQTESLVRLVDDLLDVARIAQGKLRVELAPVDLSEIVARSVDVARPSFERLGVPVSANTGAGILIGGDASRLEQIVANILDNALKYTPAGGRVDVTVSVVEDRMARLRVTDNGAGIDKRHLEKGLLGLFAQGDTRHARRKGGLGIGLSLVHRLVTLHGGTAALWSAGPGLGTEVTIDLPLSPASASVMPVVRVIEGDRLFKPVGPVVSRRVLLVDDHVDSCEFFQYFLQGEGHFVSMADTGERAIALLVTEIFDVAVIDIGLPDLDGYDVARLAREKLGSATPFLVAMTGYGGTREREAASRAGFDLYLVKPIDAAALSSTIAAVGPRDPR